MHLSRRGFLAASLLTCVTGCPSLSQWRRQKDEFASRNNCPLKDATTPTDYVDYLNTNVDRVQSWRADRVQIRANNFPLTAVVAVERAHHLRIQVNSALGQEVDFGSNDDIFWFWAKRNDPPNLMYARHDEMAEVQRRFPLPFEPVWLMEVLGVSPMDASDMTLERSPDGRSCSMSTTRLSPQGIPVKRVLTVDACHGLVLEHGLYDPHGRRIAQAQLRNHFRDEKTGAILPRKINIEWPPAEMSLAMTLDKVEVNPPSIPEQIWQPPEMPAHRVVNLTHMAS